MKRTYFRRVGAVIAASVLLTTAAACGGSSGPTESEDGTIKISMGFYPKSSLSLPVLVAIDQGLFEKHGLEVEQVSGKDQTELTSALIGGTTDVGPQTTTSAFAALDAGEDLVLLGPIMKPSLLLLAKPELASAGVDALKGKRIGVSVRGSFSEVFATAVLEEAGLSADDVTFITTGGAANQAAAMSQDQIDAVVSTATGKVMMEGLDVKFGTLAESQAGDGGDIGGRIWQNFYGLMRSTLDEHPEIPKKWCSAMDDALEFIRDVDNGDELSRILAAESGVTPEEASAILEVEREAWGAELTEETFKTNAEWALGANASKLSFDTAAYSC